MIMISILNIEKQNEIKISTLTVSDSFAGCFSVAKIGTIDPSVGGLVRYNCSPVSLEVLFEFQYYKFQLKCGIHYILITASLSYF